MSIWHWLVLIAVVALLFGGRGKVSDLMGDFAKGIKAFKKGLSDEDTAATPPPPPPPAAPVDPRILEAQSAANARREESKVL